MDNRFSLKLSKPKFYEKIQVKSKIVLGDKFVEYRYQKSTENFVGLWRKVGAKVIENPSTSIIQCSSCVSHSEEWPHLRGIHKPVSFQCPGQTKPFNQYEWNVG